ncbi:MAG: glycine cleavage system protein H [Calditrichaeota bacterium]|nr:glycine cleavage system protein H [Calditrichota bacterium]
MTVIMVALTFVAFIVAGIIVDKIRKRQAAPLKAKTAPAASFQIKPEDLVVPMGLFFYRGHTWAKVEPNGEIKIGISDFAQRMFKKIDSVEVGEVGAKVMQGDKTIAIKQGNREVQLSAPVSGEIQAINRQALENPDALKSDPYGKGWLLSIKPGKLMQDIRYLRISQDARLWMNDQVERLKDFLMREFSNGRVLPNTMADGGIPVDGISEFLDEDSWERAKETFLI